MCEPVNNEILKVPPKPTSEGFDISLLNEFLEYDVSSLDVPYISQIFLMRQPLGNMFIEKMNENNKQVHRVIKLLSSCIRMADAYPEEYLFQEGFEHIWRLSKIRFISMFEEPHAKKVISPIQHQTVLFWTELYKLSKIVKKLPTVEDFDPKFIPSGFIAVMLAAYSCTSKVVSCTCVANAWKTFLQYSEQPFLELYAIGRTPNVHHQNENVLFNLIGEWGVNPPTLEPSGPTTSKIMHVNTFQDALGSVVGNLSRESVLAVLFALSPNVCTNYGQVGRFANLLCKNFKYITYNLHHILAKFIDRSPEIVPYLCEYVKFISLRIILDDGNLSLLLQLTTYLTFANILKTTTGNLTETASSLDLSINLIAKCVSKSFNTPDVANMLITDLNQFWLNNDFLATPARVSQCCMFLAALSPYYQLSSVSTQMNALVDKIGVTVSGAMWMMFATLQNNEFSKCKPIFNRLKSAVIASPENIRFDILDAMKGTLEVISPSSRSHFMTLFPHTWVKGLHPQGIRTFFRFIRPYSFVKEYLDLLVPHIMATSSDIDLLIDISVIQLGLSKLSVWKQLIESSLNTREIFRFIYGVFESVGTIIRENHGVVCGMAMYIAIVQHDNPATCPAIQRVLQRMIPNKSVIQENVIIDTLLAFVASASNAVNDEVFDSTNIERVATAIRAMPEENRVKPLNTCVKLLYHTDFSRWANRNISANNLPHVFMIKTIIKPYIVLGRIGQTEGCIIARKAMLLKLSHLQLPEIPATKTFLHNFFIDVNKAVHEIK